MSPILSRYLDQLAARLLQVGFMEGFFSLAPFLRFALRLTTCGQLGYTSKWFLRNSLRRC